MNSHVQLVADLDPRQVHQCRIKNDALRITDLRNRFGHDVILCFTWSVRHGFSEILIVLYTTHFFTPGTFAGGDFGITSLWQIGNVISPFSFYFS